MHTYQPINCEFHDVIESYATRRASVDIVMVVSAGSDRIINSVVADVFSRAGVEFLVTQCGQEIRLDHLKSIGDYQKSAFEQIPSPADSSVAA